MNNFFYKNSRSPDFNDRKKNGSFKNTFLSKIKQTLFIIISILAIHGNVFGQQVIVDKNQWGISASALTTIGSIVPFKWGAGSEFRIWHQRAIGNGRAIRLSIGYRNQIGYNIQSSHSITYVYPTIFRQVLKTTDLTGLKYLDLELGLKQRLRETSFLCEISLRLSRLITADGGIKQQESYTSFENGLLQIRGSNNFTKPLEINNFQTFDIGTQLQLIYQMNPKLAFKLGGYYGFVNFLKTSLFGTSRSFHNASVSLGCHVQVF